MLQKYCLALDLKEEPSLIQAYDEWHSKVWPEILESIRQSGVQEMEIFRAGNRLFMIMEVNEQFSFEAKAKADENNQKVQEWENLMWQFQQALPFAKQGEKWVLMNSIFKLSE